MLQVFQNTDTNNKDIQRKPGFLSDNIHIMPDPFQAPRVVTAVLLDLFSLGICFT